MTEHETAEPMRYEPNPKHKEPWQRGARGSLCRPDASGRALLAASEPDPDHAGKRFATDCRHAYCGHEQSPGRWHGFPVEFLLYDEADLSTAVFEHGRSDVCHL